MTQHEYISAFSTLGKFLASFRESNNSAEPETANFENLILGSAHFNSWFVEENVRSAVAGIAHMLEKDKLEKWLAGYTFKENLNPKRVGVIMAGNIPMVGFHDFLCVLISGNICVAKLSSQDNRLLKAIAAKLIAIETRFKDRIIFEDGKLENIDAIIATGSNNTSRYFEYYFGKYPNIIRKNRNSVAVLTGTETTEQLALLGDDIFLYFGLGCRNVSKLYVPEGYNFDNFFNAIESRKKIVFHAKYANNYDYNKAILLVGKQLHFDNGFLLLKEDEALSTPVSRLNYSFYKDMKAVKEELENRKAEIQCVVSAKPSDFNSGVSFGDSQKPELWDYADGIDTMKFLLSL
ncbi:MAG: acyl-CoA reductase [Bacteroidia bacterium]